MTLYSADSFDRTNETTAAPGNWATQTDGAGTLDPLTWTTQLGTCGINANQAYGSALAAGGDVTAAIATVDLGTADADVSVTLSTIVTNAALVFRFSDTSNYWILYEDSSNTYLYKEVAGTLTQVGSAHAGPANGDVVRVVATGSSIKIYRGATLLDTVTDGFNSTATKFGYFVQSTSSRLDDFSASSIAATTPQLLSTTQTQTPTIDTSVTYALMLAATQIQSPSLIATPTVHYVTLLATQAQSPTLVAPAPSSHPRTLAVTQTQTPRIIAAHSAVAPPTVTNVSPGTGDAGGGTSVTVTGTGFSTASAVYFGASSASFVIVNSTTITATSPPHTAGTFDVTVVAAGGASSPSGADTFEFLGVSPDPVTIRVIDIDGNPHTASGLTGGVLALAMCKSITRLPNAPKSAEIVFPKYAYTRDDVHLFADDSGTGDLHLIEVVRNNIVRFRGVAVVADSQSSDGEVTLHCQGLDWILGRRFLDGQRTNELVNPSFESGTDSGWSDVGPMISTVTTDDAVRGVYSLRLESLSPLGDIYKKQTVSIHGTGVGTFVTIVQYFKLESIGGHALDRRGLYVEARESGVLKGNNYYAIDEATPTGEWIRAKTTIAVPPLATWDIEVRLYSPPGSILWDDGQVVAMQSISTATITGNTFEPIDVSQIVGLILDHVQDPSVGKSDLHITLDATTVGVKQVKHIQWADHISWDDQMSEWLDRDDCFDYAIRNNLDGTNELAMLVPRAGTDRTGTVTLTFPEGNVASFEFTEDGGGTITDDTELDDDTGDGPDREEGHYADASLIGGLTLQSINAAPTKSEPSSLDPLAREKVKKARRPAQLIKATINGAALLSGTAYDEVLGIGDLVNVAFDAGWIAVADTGRISQLTEYPSTDRRLEVTVAVTI